MFLFRVHCRSWIGWYNEVYFPVFFYWNSLFILIWNSTALEQRIINQLKLATQPSLSQGFLTVWKQNTQTMEFNNLCYYLVSVDWGKLGSAEPPSYDQIMSALEPTSTTSTTTGGQSSPRSTSSASTASTVRFQLRGILFLLLFYLSIRLN